MDKNNQKKIKNQKKYKYCDRFFKIDCLIDHVSLHTMWWNSLHIKQLEIENAFLEPLEEINKILFKKKKINLINWIYATKHSLKFQYTSNSSTHTTIKDNWIKI